MTFTEAARIVWAWGSHAPKVRKLVSDRRAQVEAIVDDVGRPFHKIETGTMGTTQTGAPCHPLMLAYTREFRRDAWQPRS